MKNDTHASPIVRLRGVPTVIAAALGLAIPLVGTQLGTAAAATFTWSGVTGLTVTPPANAGPEPNSLGDWSTCPTAASCVGIGSYTDNTGADQAEAATKTGGTWGPASEIMPPANAASNPNDGINVGSALVACPAWGSCVLVNSYTDTSGDREAMAAEQTSGLWGQASEITLPANAASNPEASVFSVACSAAGPCVAVGGYEDSSGAFHAMVLAQTGGSWHASEVTPPGNAAVIPRVYSGSVACSAAGSCVAADPYIDSAGNREAMVLEETGGSWGQASEITLPANAASSPETELGSVACSAAGSCVAAGEYTDEHGGREAMAADETNGSWGQADEITLPANAASNAYATVQPACPAAGSCVAVGSYNTSAGGHEAMVAEETGGSWGQASEITPPENAANNPGASLRPACPAAGSCVAVGSYNTSAGGHEAMVVEETGGSWGQASEITPPENAANNPRAIFGPVECPAMWSCRAAGVYTNSADHTEDMEVTGTSSSTSSTALVVSNATPTVGETVTYTATVTPGALERAEPSGSVEFLDGSVSIGTCSAQPLTQSLSSSTATCKLSYPAAGMHSITAQYSGDTNYSSSSSTAQTVTVQASPTGGGSTTGSGGSTGGGGTGSGTGGSTAGAGSSSGAGGTQTPPGVGARAIGKPLTHAQQLAKAIAACHKLKKSKRAKCVAAAKKRYPLSRPEAHKNKRRRG